MVFFRYLPQGRGFLFFLAFSFFTGALNAGELLLPRSERSPALNTRIRFWQDIFTSVSKLQCVLHDAEDLDIKYEMVTLVGDAKLDEKKMDLARAKVEELLQRLIDKEEDDYSDEEFGWYGKLHQPSKQQLAILKTQIRCQQGVSEMFRTGLIRSQKYIGEIRRIFAARNLPTDLAYLPHLESSFNHLAESKAGAVGLWQFIKETGKRYLKINYLLDERRDPISSTKAAARLMQANYDALETWALAITAYNYGRNGMRRAVSQIGSQDLDVIIENHQSPYFGFASKNFFAAFLAVIDIAKQQDEYFSSLPNVKPYRFSVVLLSESTAFSDVITATQLTVKQFFELNPMVRTYAAQHNLYLPRNYELRVPVQPQNKIDRMQRALRHLNQKHAHAKQSKNHYRVKPGETLLGIAIRNRISLDTLLSMNNIAESTPLQVNQKLIIPLGTSFHRVRRGQNLSSIALHYKTSLNKLMAVNNISPPALLRIGQKLIIPH